MIRRREFITFLGSAAAWPLAVRAQQDDRVRRIGVLVAGDENDPLTKSVVSAFTQALAGLGWTDGRNVRMDVRRHGDDINRIRALAQELVGLQPDIIATDSTPATAALQRETRTIPIVFAGVTDPVGSGIVPRAFPKPRAAQPVLTFACHDGRTNGPVRCIRSLTGGSEEGSGAAPRRPPPHWLAGQNRTKSRGMGQYECAAPSRSVDAPRGTRVN